MNKRQLKKVINSGRFCSVMVEGQRYYDASVKGRTVLCWDQDHDGPYVEMSGDICECTVNHLARGNKRRVIQSFVGGKSTDVTHL